MLEVYTYNAGKGDCIRLRFAGTHNIFIDSGVSRFAPAFRRICNQIKQSGETLDVLVLTHVDDDHKFDNNMWNKLYRRKLFDDLLFPEGKNFEDIAVMHRIVRKANSVVVIPMLGYHYRVREGSITKIYTAKNLMDYADSKSIVCGMRNPKVL